MSIYHIIAAALMLAITVGGYQVCYRLGFKKGADKAARTFYDRQYEVLEATYRKGIEDGRMNERQYAMRYFQEVLLPKVKEMGRNAGFEEAMKTLTDTWNNIDL